MSICAGHVWVLASGGAVVVVVTVGAQPSSHCWAPQHRERWLLSWPLLQNPVCSQGRPGLVMVWVLHPKPGVADTQCCTDVGRHRPAPRLGGGQSTYSPCSRAPHWTRLRPESRTWPFEALLASPASRSPLSASLRALPQEILCTGNPLLRLCC